MNSLTQEWTISIEAVGDHAAGPDFEDALVRFLELLADRGGSVSGSQSHDRFGATFSITPPGETSAGEAVTPELAATMGADVFRHRATLAGLPEFPINRLEVLTWAEHDADLERSTIPELVGVTEIAELLGVTRQRASALSKSKRFPARVAKLKGGPVWTRASLNHFLEDWDRKPGRPKLSLDRAEVTESSGAHAM